MKAPTRTVRMEMVQDRVSHGLAQPFGALAAPGDAAPELDRLIRRGDRCLEEEDYTQAADCYRRALALQPDSPDILDGLAGALIHDRQLADAEAVIFRLFETGGSATIGVVHHHFLDYCVGTLILSPMRVSYQPVRSDHAFSARTIDLISIGESHLGVLPSIAIRIRESGDKEKSHEFVIPAYLTRDPAIREVGEAFYGDGHALSDTARVGRLLLRTLDHH